MKNLRLTLILTMTVLLLAPLTCKSMGRADRFYEDGLEYMRQENLDKALESFTKSIDIDPVGNPEAYFYRAKVYGSLGKHEESAFDYLKSCELGSAHCGEVMPDKLVHLKKVPKCEWEAGDFGYHVAPQGGNSYGPLNAVDGLSRTAWVTKDDPSSILGDMMIGFKSLSDATVSKFTIRSGYCKSMDIWKKNSRAKKVAVIINGKPVGAFELKDTIDEQTFPLGKDYSLKAGDVVSFLILETYPGSKYADVAISEIRLANDIETVMNDTDTIPLPMTLYPYSPMRGGNPGRTNTYDEEGVPVFHGLKWKFKTGFVNTSTPCVTGGVIYFGSMDFNFYAVDIKNGKGLWRFKTEGWIVSSPCVADGVVYFGSDDNCIYALDSKTGKKLWLFESGGSVISSPCVVDGVVYCGSDNGNLYAINSKTGKELWRFKTGDNVRSSPSVVDGVVYFESKDCNLYAVDVKTGQELWRFKTEKWINPSPAVVDGVVYLQGGHKELYAVDAKTGGELLKFQWKSCIGVWCLSDGVIYFSSSKDDLYECYECDTIYAVDIKSGLELWHSNFWVDSGLCVVDGAVYFISGKNLCSIDTQTGKELWRFKTVAQSNGGAEFSNPCVVDGVVYFGSFDGYLYAVE